MHSQLSSPTIDSAHPLSFLPPFASASICVHPRLYFLSFHTKPNRRAVLEGFGAAVDDGFADGEAAADFDPAFAAEAEVEDARAGDPVGLAVAALVLFGDEHDEA